VVKPGVFAPACIGVEMSGWAGTLIDIVEAGSELLCMVEWDRDTYGLMPTSYLNWCDREELGPELALLFASHLELVGSPSPSATDSRRQAERTHAVSV
jgi:hypothetical protein